MEPPLLYRQLLEQLRQWIVPKDRRHLQGFAESVAAITSSERLFEPLVALFEPSRLQGS